MGLSSAPEARPRRPVPLDGAWQRFHQLERQHTYGRIRQPSPRDRGDRRGELTQAKQFIQTHEEDGIDNRR